jgi:hypothetical protein
VHADREEEWAQGDRGDRVGESLAGVEKTPDVVHVLTIAEAVSGAWVERRAAT